MSATKERKGAEVWHFPAKGRKFDEWGADYNGDAAVATSINIGDKTGRTVAIVMDTGFDDTRVVARAWLVSAAPEMLEALKQIHAVLRRTPTGMLAITSGKPEEAAFAAVEAAITKATGEDRS